MFSEHLALKIQQLWGVCSDGQRLKAEQDAKQTDRTMETVLCGKLQSLKFHIIVHCSDYIIYNYIASLM